MNIKKKYQNKKGFGLIESLVSITIFVLIAAVFSATYFTVNRATLLNNQKMRADRILSESIEAVRSIRDQNFLYLQNGAHGLVYNNNRWSFSGTSDLVDGQFTRVVTISDIYRNGGGDIDPAGSTLDDRTKGINIYITWTGITGNQSISTDYTLSDTFAFDSITSNTSEWDDGNYDDTISADSGDGSVTLDTYVEGWENSINNTSYLYEENENANANSVDIVGIYAYVVGNNNGQSDNFRILDITDPSNANQIGGFNSGSDITDIAVVGNYAYLSTDANNSELEIVDISNPSSLSVEYSVDLTDNKSGHALFYDGTYLHMGMNSNSGSEYYMFDISTPTAPSIAGQYEVGGAVNDIDVDSQRAYLATQSSASLTILDVSNPSSLSVINQISTTAQNQALGVDFRDNKIYVGSKKSSTDSELKIYDATNPASLVELGELEINDQINDVEVYETNAYITTNTVNQEFNVIDVSDPANPSIITSFDMGADGNKMMVDDTAIYVASEDNNSPFYIFTQPQEVYHNSGQYDSVAIDSGSDTTIWQSFYWDGILPSNTTISIQLRTADTEANLSTATWVGPDGTNATSYDQQINEITISPSASGTRWLQYQVEFTGDGTYSPEVYSVRFQYAP